MWNGIFKNLTFKYSKNIGDNCRFCQIFPFSNCLPLEVTLTDEKELQRIDRKVKICINDQEKKKRKQSSIYRFHHQYKI